MKFRFQRWVCRPSEVCAPRGASQNPIDVGGKSSSNGESLAPPESYIDPFHISPTEVPAWTVAEVGKQGVNAYLVFRLEEHELGFAALQADRIIALDFHHPELTTALRDPVSN
jgi:hypothetical protein